MVSQKRDKQHPTAKAPTTTPDSVLRLLRRASTRTRYAVERAAMRHLHAAACPTLRISCATSDAARTPSVANL